MTNQLNNQKFINYPTSIDSLIAFKITWKERRKLIQFKRYQFKQTIEIKVNGKIKNSII